MDPSGLTLEQVREKLKVEDNSRFRQAMDDLNFLGEEPQWEKLELLDRVSGKHEGSNPDGQLDALKKELKSLQSDRVQLSTKL